MSNDAPADLLTRLRAALAARPGIEIQDSEAGQAAVAMIVSAGAEPSVLFIKRRERAGDPWSGHMALPGGFRSPGDPDLLATAVRETLEETGLDLQASGQLLGTLDDVAPRSVMLPRVVVRPFVFAVASSPDYPPSDEVEEVVWLRLDDLYDPAFRLPLTLDLPIGTRTFESVQVRGYTIWGLTERILASFKALA